MKDGVKITEDQIKKNHTEIRNELEIKANLSIQEAIDKGDHLQARRLKRHYDKWIKKGRPLIYSPVVK